MAEPAQAAIGGAAKGNAAKGNGTIAARRFLTFRVDGRLYALPAEDVAEIILVPPAARLPHSPHSLMGLANLRGTVLPVVDLSLLLERPAFVPGRAARAIVLTGAAPVALAVEAVDSLVAPETAQIETGQAELAATPGELLSGAFQTGAGGDVAKILDLPALLGTAFGQRAPSTAHASGLTVLPVTGTTQSAANDAGTREEEHLLVSFDVAGQHYALALGLVREIMPFPTSIAVVPRSEAVLLGVTAYRDGLLPLLSLRGLLGFPGADKVHGGEVDGTEKVIVTPVAGGLIGLVADRMRAILRAGVSRIDPAPAMLAARSGGESRITAIFRGENGQPLVSVLAPEHLFREDVMRRLGSSAVTASTAPAQQDVVPQEIAQFVVFRLGHEEFGLPISAVDEVARVPEQITRVPKTPKFLEGVINLRGEVLPVVDQRRRFDLPKFAGGDGTQRLIVVRAERHRAGLIVDSVSEVLRAPAAAIGPAPDLSHAGAELISGVINAEATGRMILLLDPSELLTRAEHGVLDKLDLNPDDARAAAS
jgi:purine-binding chemotaxis protein CheW